MKPFLHLLALLFFASTLWGNEPIKVVVSDLMKETLSSKYLKEISPPDTEFDITYQGSYFAKKEIREGLADLAIVPEVLPSKDFVENFGDEYSVIPLAYKTFFLVVNRTNPLSEISVTNARDVFVSDSDLKFQNWSALGISGTEYVGTSIQLYTLDDSFMTFSMFEAQVMERRPVKSSLTRQDSFSSLIQRVGTDTAIMALLSRPPLDPRIKVLAISGKDSDFAFMPTSENLFYGDYPFGMVYYLVLKKDANLDVKALAKSIFSGVVFDKLEKEGLLILDEKLRRQVLLESGL